MAKSAMSTHLQILFSGCAAPGVYRYTTLVTGATFTLNTEARMQADAEAICQSQGGHLAIFSSAQEQQDVEKGFTALGGLIPVFHQRYWLGIMAQDWPMFVAMDSTLGTTYRGWADLQPDDAADPPELCAVAVDVGDGSTWKWDDVNCGQSQIFMCRLLRGWLAHQIFAQRTRSCAACQWHPPRAPSLWTRWDRLLMRTVCACSCQPD
jgi:hypothetical protein